MNPNILHWSYRDFYALPTNLIDHGDTLEEIYLKENFLTTLPQWFFEFVHLKFIQLSGNLLQMIPDEIGNLINLEYLDVSKNHLTALPLQLTGLNKLQYLNVSENELTALHSGEEIFTDSFMDEYCFSRECWISEMGAMKSLGTLNVSKNRLTQIPLALAASTSIMELVMNDNYFVEIPAKIMAMKNLKVFEADRKFRIGAAMLLY